MKKVLEMCGKTHFRASISNQIRATDNGFSFDRSIRHDGTEPKANPNQVDLSLVFLRKAARSFAFAPTGPSVDVMIQAIAATVPLSRRRT